jgi:PAS domain S-box-containing protein
MHGADLIVGSGQMAGLVRNHDWKSTPLGPIDGWSKELLTVVNLTLCTSAPTRVLWGSEFLLIYNDAYREILGTRHPKSLGRPASYAWKDVWSTVAPQLETAFNTGRSTSFEKLPVIVDRDGKQEELYLNYSYSPVHQEGKIAGLFGHVHYVTAEVNAVRKLHESEARCSRILQSIGDAVIVTDADTSIMLMNPVAENLTGWTEEEASGRQLADVFRIIDEETRQPMENPVDKVKRFRGVVGLANHTILVARNGTDVHIDDSSAPIRDEQNDLAGIVLVFRDIGKRRAAERRHDALIEQLNQVMNATTDGIVSVNRDWIMTYANPRATDIYAAIGGVIDKNVWETFPEAVYEGSPYVEHYERAMNEGIGGHFEAYYPEPLNAWLDIMVHPTRDGLVTFSRDITQRKQNEAARRENEAKLTLATAAARLGIFTWYVASDSSVWENDHMYEIVGRRREDGTVNAATFAREILYPEFVRVFEDSLSNTVRTGAALNFQGKIHRGDGTDGWVQVTAHMEYDANGAPYRALGTMVDITAHKLAEDELRTSQSRLKAIYDSTHEYLGLLTPDGIMIDCNRAALSFAGNSLEDVVGTPFWLSPWFASTPGAPELLRRWIDRAAAGEFIRQEAQLLRPTGEPMLFDFALSPIRDASGNVTLLVPEARDITDLKRVETALIQSEKLAAVGRLASSIAHEINNPLESVTNLLYLARCSTELSHEVKDYLDTAERELRRVSVITNQTLRFHKQATRPTQISCEDLLAASLQMFQGRIVNSHVKVEKRYRATLPITCFEGEIRQVLNNLIGNAIDSMPHEGARLLLRSREATDWKTDRKGVIITIADGGSGMDPMTVKKVFEAFFTTKGIGGTGLGLWVSHEIIIRHRGEVRVRSSRNPDHRGTVFTVFLPLEASIREDSIL